MTFAKKIPARLAQFTLLLAFVGLTSLPGFAQKRADQPHIGQVQDSSHRHIVPTDTNDVQTADQPDIGPVQDSSDRHIVSTDTNHVQTANRPHIGLVQDWSHRYIVFTDTNDVQTRVKQSGDLRALSFWVKRGRVQHPNKFVGGPIVIERGAPADKSRKKGGGGSGGAISGVSVDWALPLGKGRGASAANYGGLAAGAYPAKYSFDINAAPNCTNDYIAMGLNTPGLAGYPNIVGINNLYVNSTGTGFCPTLTAPTALFAYFTASANPTSVVVSLDGTKIAWVEDAATPVFHVLAWQAGQGTLAAPVAPTVVTSAPVVGSGTMTSLTLTSAVNDTNSSPYVDYSTDTAYVGSDNGRLYKVTNVFCQTIGSPTANSTCATAQPTLDATWGATGVSVAATTGLTSPVVDTYLATPLVFVGASSGTSLGSVFARIAATGVAPTTPSISPGRAASANGGVVDPPVIDVTNHKLYATAGCDTTNNLAVAVQNPYTSTGFGASVTATIGSNTAGAVNCPTTNMHAGTPDDTYITSIQNSAAIAGTMIFCGTVQAGNPSWKTVLYKFGFTGGAMHTAPDATSGAAITNGMGLAGANAECSAVTDVFNSNFGSQTERIYMGMGGATSGGLRSFDATFATPGASGAIPRSAAWTALNGVITFPLANSPITIGPGNYVTIAATGAGTCNANTNGTFEVASSTTTQITFNNPAITTSPCTGTNAGTATSDSTIPGISLVDITTPAVLRATSGIIIDNVAATGSFAEASNIYFTQLGAGNIAGGSCPATATITTITRPGFPNNLVNTAAAHGLVAGDTVTISGNATAANNGVFAVIAPVTATSFTYADAGGAAGAGGSVFAKACIYKLSQSGLQ